MGRGWRKGGGSEKGEPKCLDCTAKWEYDSHAVQQVGTAGPWENLELPVPVPKRNIIFLGPPTSIHLAKVTRL